MEQMTTHEALRVLEPLVGEWMVEATWADGRPWPDGGWLVFEWHTSRAHLLQRMTLGRPDAPATESVIGCDSANGTFHLLSADSEGLCRVYEMSIGGGEWTMWRSGRPYAERYTGTFSEDGRTITGRWDKAEDGVTFQPHYEMVYRKVEY